MKGALLVGLLVAGHGRPGLELLTIARSGDQYRPTVHRSKKGPSTTDRRHPRLVVLVEETGKTTAMQVTTHQDSGRICHKGDDVSS